MTICHINLAKGYRGGERQTELLVRGLAAHGLAQRLVVRAGQPLASRLSDVANLDLVAVDRPFALRAAQVRGSLVHAHETRGTQLAWLRWRTAGTPYLVTRRIGKRPSNSWLTRAIYRNASARIGVAESVSHVVADYAGRPARTIYSALSDLPVDQETRARLRERWGDVFVIVNVAALVDAQKGQSHLIEVARKAEQRGLNWRFVFVGDGRDRECFRAQADGLSNIEFTGFVNNVGDYLAAADLFVLPSRHEGIGGAALDAMRAGLPVVASAVDGLPEFIDDGANGLLVAPGDEAGLLRAIETLADDDARRDRLAEAGRVTAETFTVARMVAAYRDVYRDLGYD